MALTVEDGTGVEGANSYVTIEEARAYAALRGLDVPAVATPDPLEALLVRAKDYLEAFRARYKGSKTNGYGFLQWPRTDVSIDAKDFPKDAIPQELKDAQSQLAVELQTVDPTEAVTGPAIRQETIGSISTTYAVGDNAAVRLPSFPKVMALLAPLLNPSALRTVRN